MSIHARPPLPMRDACAALAALLLAVLPVARAERQVNDPLTLLNRPRDAGPDAPQMPAHPQKNRAVEEAIGRGLEFLESWQSPNGSWDRLENNDPGLMSNHKLKQQMGKLDLTYKSPAFDGPVKDLAENSVEEVADTCLSGQVMLDAITSGRRPELSRDCIKSIDFVCKQIDKWNGDTIYIQSRVFDPIHDKAPMANEPLFYDPTVDTFFALRFLTDARAKIEKPEVRKQIDRALAILLDKVARRQDIYGTWPDDTDPILALSGAHFNSTGNSSFREARSYSNKYPNIVTHCMAMKAINEAARQGLRVKAETRYRAENYLHLALETIAWGGASKGAGSPYVVVDDESGTAPILATVIVSTLYDVDRTARELAAQARADQAAASDQPAAANELRVLEKRAADAHAHLVDACMFFTRKFRLLATCGPALPCIPDLLNALREAAPEELPAVKKVLIESLLARQKASDGRFVSGFWVDESKHPNRGDNTFGTATSVDILMQLEDLKLSEPAK